MAPSSQSKEPPRFPGRFKAGKVKAVQGSETTVSTTGGVKVDAANRVKTDIVADNGVIQVIDSAILPK